jgi:signal transduction histidine kinase
MKLAAHYNRANIITTLLVLIAGAAIYYFAINYIADKQLDHYLLEETSEANDFIKEHHKLPQKNDLEDQQTMFAKAASLNSGKTFFDTLYTDGHTGKIGPGRAELSLVTFNGDTYKTTVIISSANTKYFVQLIMLITLALTIALLITLFITNRYILKGLWRPFYATLGEIKAFNVADAKNFGSTHGDVDEFNELNEAVQVMSARVKTDFQHLKQFTENASHEMRTPLAVITAKLDMLIQDETLKRSQYEQLTDIYTATGKLSRLNHALVLLVKIENNLIHDEEKIELDEVLSEKLKHFQELLASKNIQLKKELHHQALTASKYLTDILLNNLLSNAIRHNIDHGNLTILLTNGMLVIQNSGVPTPLNPEQVFERFQKSQKSDGTGLGLAIVKNICNMYGWKVNYDYNDQLHTFQVIF